MSIAHMPSKLVQDQLSAWKARRPVATAGRDVADFVSVSRVFASGGGMLARALAQRLEWAIFDRTMLQEMAAADQVREELREPLSEFDTAWLDGLVHSFEHPVRRLAEVVLALARRGNAVFLGRAADIILPRASGLRIRVAAAAEWCVRHYATRQGVTMTEAREEFERIERARSEFTRRYFRTDPYEPVRYDLTFNMERFTTDQAVDVILAAMRAKGVSGV